MNEFLSITDLVNLPILIQEKASQYCDVNGFLRKEKYEKLYNDSLKNKVVNLFNRFEDIKFSEIYSSRYDVKITSNWNLKEFSSNKSISDPTANKIEKIINDETWIKSFYNSLLNVAIKLTIEENIFLIDYFFKGLSLEVIAAKLCVSRPTVYNKIMKSCIVKIGLEFELVKESA